MDTNGFMPPCYFRSIGVQRRLAIDSTTAPAYVAAGTKFRCILFADEIFGFHVQQTVEKALKAWLCTFGSGNYPLTHELARLFSLPEKQGAEVEAFWPLVQYTMFAV